MRVTTETLSQVTNLLAIVSAPPLETATIRHVEVLLLQPQVLMVVVITSTGGVTQADVRPSSGRSTPASPTGRASYLNERLVGLGLGARTARPAAVDPSLAARERAFLDGAGARRSPSSTSPPRTRSTSTAPRACCASDRFAGPLRSSTR